jgi:hypothetical protein
VRRDLALLICNGIVLLRLQFEVFPQVGIESDEVDTILGRHFDTQPFEEFGNLSRRHVSSTSGRDPDRLPEQDVGVGVRRDALAKALVEGGLVVDIALPSSGPVT